MAEKRTVHYPFDIETNIEDLILFFVYSRESTVSELLDCMSYRGVLSYKVKYSAIRQGRRMYLFADTRIPLIIIIYRKFICIKKGDPSSLE